MNQYQYKSAMERELQKINQRIDMKIISGLDYGNDAKRHKRLLSEMRRLGRKQSFWPSAFRFVTTFLF